MRCIKFKFQNGIVEVLHKRDIVSDKSANNLNRNHYKCAWKGFNWIDQISNIHGATNICYSLNIWLCYSTSASRHIVPFFLLSITCKKKSTSSFCFQDPCLHRQVWCLKKCKSKGSICLQSRTIIIIISYKCHLTINARIYNFLTESMHYMFQRLWIHAPEGPGKKIIIQQDISGKTFYYPNKNC